MTSRSWVCPNDRVLALRAKLDAGWSVRSNSPTPGATLSRPLGSSSILNAYDSDNDLDELQPPQVSSRLLSSSPTMDSMTSFGGRNSRMMEIRNQDRQDLDQGNSSSNCSISEREQQTIINVITRAQQLEQMEKDRVKKLIDRLNNLKMNSKGGDGRNYCSLCSEKFSFLFGSKVHYCKDCQKAVCSKCSLDTVTTTGDTIWFCKICSETREMWKKSGAWFFNSIPYYYSDVAKVRRPSVIGSRTHRKFSSCKESQLTSPTTSTCSSSLSTTNQDNNLKVNHSHRLSDTPSPSNSMMSLDSVVSTSTIQNFPSSSSNLPFSASGNFQVPPSPGPSSSNFEQFSNLNSSEKSEPQFFVPSSSGFQRNKYNSTRILSSSRKPIRRKSSKRSNDNNSSSSSRTTNDSNVPEKVVEQDDDEDDLEGRDVFKNHSQGHLYGLHAKTSEFTASLGIKTNSVTELWQLPTDSTDNDQ